MFYKKILFDLDNTLIDDDENRKYAIKKVIKNMRGNVDKKEIEDFIKFDNKYWKDRAEGKIKDPYKFKTIEEKTEWVRAERFIRFFKNISYEEAVKINDSYIKDLNKNVIQIKNAEEVVKYLFERNYEIYIITNGPTIPAKSKLEKINVNKYIKTLYTAEEAGFMKPHKEFFDKFFKKIDAKATNDMLIIGDELEKDILGGIRNNIDTCWFNIKNEENKTEIKPDMEIKKLIDLKNIL